MADSGRILLVEDDADQLKLVKTILEADGWQVYAAPSGEEAVRLLEADQELDVVVTDLMMPGLDGRAVLEAVRQRWPEVPVLVMTAHGSVDSAVELMTRGAHTYLQKPVNPNELRIAVKLARQATETRRELARLRRRVDMPNDVIGASRVIQEVLEAAVKVAPTWTPVLITGEPGTGKEIVARAIHASSGRVAFVPFNCAAIPPAGFELELFGRESLGGAVETARNGTLFLDEVAEVPLAAQPALRRFLKEGEFVRGGATNPEKANVRLIATSSRDLDAEVEAGRLREDLLLRLDIVRLHLPPLRERPVDVPAIAAHLLERLAQRYQLEPAELAPDALAALTAYPWPGNVRELESVLAKALALRSGRTLNLKDLPTQVARTAGVGARVVAGVSGAMLTLEEVERRHILHVLEKTGGNKLKAAEVLGIDRSTLHRKLKHLQGLATLHL